MTFGLLYADKFQKSLWNFHYWYVHPYATSMAGLQGAVAYQYLLNSDTMLTQKTVLMEGWRGL